MTVENCENTTTGLAQATSLSVVYGLSYENYNETAPNQWLDEAISILKDYQESSRYWQVFFPLLIQFRFISLPVAVSVMKSSEALFKLSQN